MNITIQPTDDLHTHAMNITADKFLQQIIHIYNAQDDFLYTQQLVQKFHTNEYELCVLLAYISNKIENDSRYHKYHSTFIALCKLISDEISISEIKTQFNNDSINQTDLNQWNNLLEENNTPPPSITHTNPSDPSNLFALNE